MSTIGVVNGRVARIRAYLTQAKTARSGPEIRRSADPDASVQQVAETICYMVRKGYAVKHGHGKGNARYTLGHVTPPSLAPSKAKPKGTSPLKRHARRANVIGTPSGLGATLDPHRAASTQIAGDIAHFLKHGGRIERLGTTRVLIHIGADAPLT